MNSSLSKKRSIVRIVLMVLISVVFGFGLYSCNAQALSGDSMPMPFGVGAGVVMSGSMEPHLSVDDLIIVKKCDKYSVGDWVVFQQRNMLIVHEVISIDYELDEVVTQGSANDTPDDPMSIKYIKGKVVKHYNGLGNVINFLKSPLVAVAILAFAVFFLVKSYKGENEEKAQQNAEQETEIERIKREIEQLKQQNSAPAITDEASVPTDADSNQV